MAIIEVAKIQVRRGQELQTGVPQLDPGEFGWAQDTQNLYIGKRIVEGANSDDNSRILTEKDLDNIFELINSTSSNILKYQYRDDIQYFKDRTTVRNVSDKLDEVSVSILDFGYIDQGTVGVDITQALRSAIEALFYNSKDQGGNWWDAETADARRQLRIPAGYYTVDQGIDLPPYTTIIGDGSGITKITFVNDSESLFRTVDADGNFWDGLTPMAGDASQAREVTIKGITLEYDPLFISNFPLLNLDNVRNAHIDDVVFATKVNSTSTTTYGLVTQGIGISLKGQGGGIGSGDSNLCQNIEITNCKFDSLSVGITGFGSIVRSHINQNLFNNLQRGISLTTSGIVPAPSNFYFLENRFQNIVTEAIFTDFSLTPTNHISERNFFIQVGNGVGLDDNVSTLQSSVIKFLSPGNRSIDDFFQRKALATSVGPGFFYNPLVEGIAVVIDNTLYSEILNNTTNLITKFPITGLNQSIEVLYKLYSSDNAYTRTGKLLINIAEGIDDNAAEGFISDYYNFTAVDTWTAGDPDTMIFSLPLTLDNCFDLVLTKWTPDPLILEYQIFRSA